MAKTLNFHNVQKQYMTVTLADEDNTVLLIGTPTKGIMDDLTSLQEALNVIQEDTSGSETTEATDDLYRACARVMSRNKTGINITTEFLAELLDFEDIIIFFDAYMDFISEVTNSKN